MWMKGMVEGIFYLECQKEKRKEDTRYYEKKSPFGFPLVLERKPLQARKKDEEKSEGSQKQVVISLVEGVGQQKITEDVPEGRERAEDKID